MTTLQVFALVAALSSPGPGEPVLYDFSAEWCGPCRSMEPTVRRLAADGFAVRQVNIDRERELAHQFRVDRVPTFVLVVDGREVDRVVGPTSYERLRGLYGAARTPGNQPARRTAEPDINEVANRESTPVPASTVDPQARAMNATVRLRVADREGSSFGTGTIIDTHGGEALIVTCGHIFRESRGRGEIQVELVAAGNQAPLPGQLISYNLEHDVGLVSIRPGMRVVPVPVASQGFQVRRGDRVFSIGCDRGGPASVRVSQVTTLNKYQGQPNIEVAGQPVIGRSGGGLFSADGQLIGVCNLADPKDNEGIYAALTLVQQNLDKIGQSRIYRRDAAQLASATEPMPVPKSRQTAVPEPPAMPESMPRGPLAATSPPIPLATVGSDDTELICIVRSKSNPGARSEVFILDRPPRELIDRLAKESPRPGQQDPVVLQASRADGPNANLPPSRWSSSNNGPVVRAQSGQ